MCRNVFKFKFEREQLGHDISSGSWKAELGCLKLHVDTVTLLSCDAAFGIGGPEDVVPRPPEHVRCKNFGCNKSRARSTRKVDADLGSRRASSLFPYTVWMLYWQSRRTSNPSAPTLVSCFSTMHSQGTLIQDTQSNRSLRLRLRQVPGPPRRHGPVCCELQWLCCVPGVFTTDYHLYFTRRQSIGACCPDKKAWDWSCIEICPHMLFM